MKRLSVGLAATCAFAVSAAAVPALAQYANQFSLAKVKHEGATTHSIAGSGTVTVQVLVKADGSHKVIRVINSSNHGDDAAALEIAQNSEYEPAHRGTKPVESFYDFTLKFNGKAVAQAQEAGPSGELDALVRAGKYDEAIARANQMLASNPNDPQTLQLLGAAQYFNHDSAASAATFDKVPAIGKTFASLAAQAFATTAVSEVQNDPQQSLAYAQKAYALAPDSNSRFALGVAQLTNKQYSDAIANLKAVHDAVPDSNLKAKLNIDSELLQAYLDTNDTTDADATAAQIKALDPNGSSASHAVAEHWLRIGADALTAKKFDDAVSAFDKAAAAGNSADAVTANTYAAFAILQMPKPDYAKARDYALKALATAPQDAQANYAAGVAFAGVYSSSQKSDDKKQALDYLNKADQYAKAAGNTALATQVEAQIKNVPH